MQIVLVALHNRELLFPTAQWKPASVSTEQTGKMRYFHQDRELLTSILSADFVGQKQPVTADKDPQGSSVYNGHMVPCYQHVARVLIVQH